MNDEYKQPYMDFETMDENDLPYCCKICMPQQKICSMRYATKRSALEGIEVQHALDHLNTTEVLSLRAQVYESLLPDADASLEYTMDVVEGAISDFKKLFDLVRDQDRGMIEGDEWKHSC